MLDETEIEKIIARLPRVIKCESNHYELFDDGPDSEIKTGDSSKKAIMHKIAVPSSLPDPEPLSDTVQCPPIPIDEMAREYAFTLDPFQQCATSAVSRGETLLVAAHTSAGKTVVAEYAIATALSKNQKIIYTSPIKALSNQKYHDLSKDFGDENIGLMTGDVTVKPDAPILVMTTEILRSMLYRGSELIREVGFVVFDEVHYMRDAERGVVWEETIANLPKTIACVFLSATIPNSEEFCSWIAEVRECYCHIIYTLYRPTPLQHFIMTPQTPKPVAIMNEFGVFDDRKFNLTTQGLAKDENLGKALTSTTKAPPKADFELIEKAVKLCMKNKYGPILLFAFSKKDVESIAAHVVKSYGSKNLINEEELEAVTQLYNEAINATLNETDKAIPEVKSMMNLLSHGVGIHHSGLLPVVKEAVEFAYTLGYIKILVATETFAMGVNSPSRTVIFSSMNKFDGSVRRNLNPSEYTQMAGRAGRRGKDAKGFVITLMSQACGDAAEVKALMKGQSEPLNSSFRLSFNMILNTYRVEGISPEKTIEKSFKQYQHKHEIFSLVEKYRELAPKLSEHGIEDKDARDYMSVLNTVNTLRADLLLNVIKPRFINPFLSAGRLVEIVANGENWGWCIALQSYSKTHNDPDSPIGCYLDVLAISQPFASVIPGKPRNSDTEFSPKPIEGGLLPNVIKGKTFNFSPVIIRVPYRSIRNISSWKLAQVDAIGLVSGKADRMASAKQLVEIIKNRALDGVSVLSLSDYGIQDESVFAIEGLITETLKELDSSPIASLPAEERSQRLADITSLMNIEEKLEEYEKQIKERLDNLVLSSELSSRTSILRRLNFIDESNFVQPKGVAACDLSSADEVLLTELIFSNFFYDATDAQLAAVLIALLADNRFGTAEKTELKLDNEYKDIATRLVDLTKDIAEVYYNCGLTDDPIVDQTNNGLDFTLALLAYKWVSGADFVDLLDDKNKYGGNIIRNFRRLAELIRQISVVADSIASEELKEKAESLQKNVYRGIVGSSSLYTIEA